MDNFPHYQVAHLFVRDYVVCVGRSEDGEDILRSRYAVIAEAHNGYRWQHERGFESEAEAEALQAVIEASLARFVDLDADHWFEIDPCYGSPAYLRAEPDIVARERREDEEGL
jgi:hypothetical protein